MVNDINVVGVQFKRAGKLFHYSAGQHDVKVGDQVVVDTDRGPTLGRVVRLGFWDQKLADPGSGDKHVRPPAGSSAAPNAHKNILRKATAKDLATSGKLTPEYASEFTKKKVKELKLRMRVLKSEVQFGGSKVIIYFSAPGRVDFRALVKGLASGLRSRVELKQVGARDEAKLVGGVGVCGREYCCSSWLREFLPVSIKMAKNQNLALNPSKVSGGCGRLLCCLTYEDPYYSEVRKKLPPRGSKVRLADGQVVDVLKADFLNQSLLVEDAAGQQESVALSDVEVLDAKSASLAEETASEGAGWADDIELDALLDEDDS